MIWLQWKFTKQPNGVRKKYEEGAKFNAHLHHTTGALYLNWVSFLLYDHNI